MTGFATCVDIGAPKFVKGKKELNRIFHCLSRRDIPSCTSHNTFRFWDNTVRSCWSVELFLATSGHMINITFIYDIVPIDVSALLDLDLLDSWGLFAVTVDQRLIHTQRARDIDGSNIYREQWSVPFSEEMITYIQKRIPKSDDLYSQRTQEITSSVCTPSVASF